MTSLDVIVEGKTNTPRPCVLNESQESGYLILKLNEAHLLAGAIERLRQRPPLPLVLLRVKITRAENYSDAKGKRGHKYSFDVLDSNL